VKSGIFWRKFGIQRVKNATITGHFVYVFAGKLGQKNHMIIVTFLKSSVSKVFSIHTKTQSRRFQIPPV